MSSTRSIGIAAGCVAICYAISAYFNPAFPLSQNLDDMPGNSPMSREKFSPTLTSLNVRPTVILFREPVAPTAGISFPETTTTYMAASAKSTASTTLKESTSNLDSAPMTVPAPFLVGKATADLSWLQREATTIAVPSATVKLPLMAGALS